MALLVTGLVLFLGMHLVPAMPARRSALVARFGERGYRGLFSAISGIGLVLIVAGFATAPRTRLFAPWPAAVAAAPVVMAIAMVLLAAANLRGHLRRALAHPMLLGTILWAGVHLLANGDLAGTVLFGGFLAWALIDLASAVAGGRIRSFEPRLAHDAISIAAGLAAFAAFAALHRVLFGPQVVPFGF